MLKNSGSLGGGREGREGGKVVWLDICQDKIVPPPSIHNFAALQSHATEASSRGEVDITGLLNCWHRCVLLQRASGGQESQG